MATHVTAKSFHAHTALTLFLMRFRLCVEIPSFHRPSLMFCTDIWSLGCVWFCLLQCETLESRYRRDEFVLRSMGDQLKVQAVGHLIEEYSKHCPEKEDLKTVTPLLRAMLKWDHRLESHLHLPILPRFLAAAKVLRPSRVYLI